MSVLIPASVNYPSPLNMVPTIYRKEPPEGPHMIPMEIDWGIMGGANNCVFANFQNNQAMNFSQVVALSVDNSQCGGDVRFIFPDTGETVTIPSYSPKTIIEVFTNMTQFYVVGLNVLTGDITSFSVHNTLPPPVSVSITRVQNIATFGSIDATTNAVTALIPAGTNGTIQAMSVLGQFADQGSDNKTVDFAIVDGAALTKGAARAGSNNNFQVNDQLLLINPANLRFSNGLNFVVTNTMLANSSTFAVNVYYTQH